MSGGPRLSKEQANGGSETGNALICALLPERMGGDAAEMLPLWDTEPHRRRPVITLLIIGACLAVFVKELAVAAQGEAALEGFVTRHGLVPARLLAGWRDAGQWGTVFSSMFLHGGWSHLLGNCWFLWVFGNNVECRLGHARYLGLYALTGVAAAAAQVLAGPGSAVPMVGASGAISGVLGAYLILCPRSWVVTLVPWIVPIIPVPAVVFLVLWFVLQAMNGVGVLMGNADIEAGVAWWAHAGGFLAGALLAMRLRRRRRS